MKYRTIQLCLMLSASLTGALGSAGCGSIDREDVIDAIGNSHPDRHDPPNPQCPDVCTVSCGRIPEDEVPRGCPVAVCDCVEPEQCPDVCAAVCSGEPEPAVPPGCPIPDCGC